MDETGLLEIIPGSSEARNPIRLNPNKTSPESTAVLEDSGNLALKESNPDGTLRRVLWQSFDRPADTLLPGMRLGANDKSALVSWLSESNPGHGAFTLEYHRGALVVKRRGNFFSSDELEDDWDEAVDNVTENHFSFSSARIGASLILRVNPDGRIVWSNLSSSTTRITACSGGLSFPSGCAAGPRPDECRARRDEFVQRGVRLLSNSSSSARYFDDDPRIVLSDCLDRCWKNCSCVGFDALNLDGTGCTFWSKGARFKEESDLFGDRFFLLNSTFHNQKSESRKSGMKRWIWVMVFAVAFWL